jgi:hypothetical protein
VLEFQSVRGLLAEWTPPPATLGFRVVQSDAPAFSPAQISMPPPLQNVQKGSRNLFWAQAAAAVLLFVAGMGASQLHFEYGNGALTVRTRTSEPAAVAEAPVVHSGTDVLLPPGSIERVSTSPRDASAASADAVLNRVQALIDRSESRQRAMLALRLQDVMRDFDAQRQADLQHIDQNFGELENQTTAESAQNRAVVNSLVRVSQQGGVK